MAAVSVCPNALMNCALGELADSAPDYLDGHGGGAVGDDAQAAHVVVVELLVVHEHLEHGRDHHGAVDALVFHKLHPALGVELALYYQSATAVDGADHRLHPGDVVHGHCEDVALVGVGVGRGHVVENVGGEAVVAQHHALGQAGGA